MADHFFLFIKIEQKDLETGRNNYLLLVLFHPLLGQYVDRASDRMAANCAVVLGQAVKDDDSDCEPVFQLDEWTALYEVLDMKILHVDSKDSVEVYGKIIFHSSTGFVFLFNREKDNPETINLPGGAITLTNPNVSVNGLNRVGISFKLEGDLEGLSDDFLGWTAFDWPFNSLLTAEIEGSNCSLAVRYVVFRRALVANVEIKLLRGDEEEEEEEEEEEGNGRIWGNINASFSEWPDLEFTLFDKTRDDCTSVGEEGVIPLSKSVISHPLGSDFDIKVNLPVAVGTVKFFPISCGEYVGIICDKIQVKVTFWSWRHHPETQKAKSNYKSYADYVYEKEEEMESNCSD